MNATVKNEEYSTDCSTSSMSDRTRRPARLTSRPIAPSWLYVLLLAACTLSVYGRILGHDFVAWDDDGHITENPRLDPISWPSLVRFWREPFFGHYVPLSYTLFTAEARLARSHRDEFGKQHFKPAIFHAGSLLLHLGCVLLAYRLLMMILDEPTAACLGALFFALHPLQVESVAWISEQRGLLAGLFTFLALMAWLKFDAGRPEKRGGTGYYLLATAAYVAALLAKPSAVCVPLLAAALDVFLLRRSWRVTAAALLPWAAAAAVMMIVTRREQPASMLSYLPPPWTRPLIAGDALQFYLARIVWPFGLIAQYPRAPLIVLRDEWIYFAWIVPALVLLACWRYRDRGPWMLCTAWFVAVLLPVLGLTPFAYQHFSTVADRYAYLAVFAPALAAAWWVAQNPSGWRRHAMAVLLCLLAALSFQQAGHWRDTEALFAHTLRHNPCSDVAHGNWGAELLRRGRYPEGAPRVGRGLSTEPQIRDREGVSQPRSGPAELGANRRIDHCLSGGVVAVPKSEPCPHQSRSGVLPEAGVGKSGLPFSRGTSPGAGELGGPL